MNARLQVRLLVAHIDRVTPRRRGEPTLADRLSRRPCCWVDSWWFLVLAAAVFATALTIRVWSA